MFPILNSISARATMGRGSGSSLFLAKGKTALAVVCSRWIAICMLLKVTSASAQEALQNMLAGQTAANSRAQQMQAPQDYTVKFGDFRMLLAPSLAASYNDNINLAQTNVLDDFIIT